MSRTMKDSGIPWIGEIPFQWQLVHTKRVFKGKKQIVGSNSEMYERLALTMKGVVKRNKDDNEGLQPEQFDSYQILENNELVFKLIDLQNIRTSRVGLSPYTGIVSPAYVILTNTKSDNRFYYYWYFDMYNRCVFNRMGGDGVRSALNLKDVLEIPIPMISDAEQHLIATFLDKKCSEIDSLIDLQEQMIEELKAYKQSVITEAVTKGLNPNVPMKDSGIEWIGDVPEEWEVCKLKYFTLKIGSGSTPTGGSEVYVNDGVKFLRSQNVYFEGLLLDDVVYISDEIDENMKGTRVLEGDVLLNITGGSIGRCFYVDSTLGRANVNQHVSIIRPYNSNTKYIKYYLQSYLGQYQVKQLQTGGNREGLSAAAIKDFRFINCPLAEQQAIADYLDKKCGEIDGLITIKQQKIESLKEYKKSVIYEYVTGKREV